MLPGQHACPLQRLQRLGNRAPGTACPGSDRLMAGEADRLLWKPHMTPSMPSDGVRGVVIMVATERRRAARPSSEWMKPATATQGGSSPLQAPAVRSGVLVQCGNTKMRTPLAHRAPSCPEYCIPDSGRSPTSNTEAS